jgi:hypothetical protein
MLTNQAAKVVAQGCYEMAYFVLPQYVFKEREKFIERISQGNSGAAFYYVLTCTMGKTEPNPEAARAFVVKTGALDGQHDYHLIRYPVPPAIDLMEIPQDQLISALKTVVLAPYFSVLVKNKTTDDAHYFVLGQSPDGGTTLREVTLEFNANLGKGSEPNEEALLALLQSSRHRQPIAGVATPRRALGKEASKKWWQFWK